MQRTEGQEEYSDEKTTQRESIEVVSEEIHTHMVIEWSYTVSLWGFFLSCLFSSSSSFLLLPLYLSLSLSRNPQRDLRTYMHGCRNLVPLMVAGAKLFLTSSSFSVLFSLPFLTPAPGTRGGVGQFRHLGEGGEVGKEVPRTSYWERRTFTWDVHCFVTNSGRRKQWNKDGRKKTTLISLWNCKIHFSTGKVGKTFSPFWQTARIFPAWVSNQPDLKWVVKVYLNI